MLTPISAYEVRDLLAKGEARLIDVRSPGEFAAERIEGAENMPLPNVPKIDGGKKVIFMCLSGARVASAAPSLEAAAGGRAYVLEGSMMGWKRAGLPVAASAKPGLFGGVFGR